MATAAQLIAQARRLAENEMIELYSDEQALDLLNQVYLELWRVHAWPFAQESRVVTLAAGQSSVVLDDCNSVAWVQDTDGRMLTERGPFPSDWRPDGAPNQVAREYFIDWQLPVGSEGPVPVLNIYTVQPQDQQFVARVIVPLTLLGANDTPVIPTQFQLILSYEMAARLLEEEADDSGRVESLRGQALSTLEQMRQQFFTTFRSFTMGERVRGKRRRVGGAWR